MIHLLVRPKRSGLTTHPSHYRHHRTHSYYTKATNILERYEHLPSFAGIRGDCQAMIDTLTSTMDVCAEPVQIFKVAGFSVSA